MLRNRYVELKKVNAATATVANAFAELDVVTAALDVSPTRIPAGLDAQAAMY